MEQRLRRAHAELDASFRHMAEGIEQARRGLYAAREAMEGLLDLAYEAHGLKARP